MSKGAMARRLMVPCGHAAGPIEPASGESYRVPEHLEWLRDVEFGEGGGRPLHLHLLRPRVRAPALSPCLVWIHGGAFRTGSRDSGLRYLPPFAEMGWVCASIEYRLSGEAIWPAQIEDCKCAIRFLRSHSEQYGLDPHRIGVWGSSAGGHLVAMLVVLRTEGPVWHRFSMGDLGRYLFFSLRAHYGNFAGTLISMMRFTMGSGSVPVYSPSVMWQTNGAGQARKLGSST